MVRWKNISITYFFGWDDDSDLFDGLLKFIWFDGTVVVEVKVLECLFENTFLRLCALSLLTEFVFQFLFETISNEKVD